MHDTPTVRNATYSVALSGMSLVDGLWQVDISSVGDSPRPWMFECGCGEKLTGYATRGVAVRAAESHLKRHTEAEAVDDDGEPLAYTVPQCAPLLGIGVRTAWALVHSGILKSYMVGASRRVSRRALLDFIEAREAAS